MIDRLIGVRVGTLDLVGARCKVRRIHHRQYHVGLIDERFRLHRRRAEKIQRLIVSQPRTAHEIAPDHFAAPPTRVEWRK